jgi:PTS system, fructose subfamily, IIA component
MIREDMIFIGENVNTKKGAISFIIEKACENGLIDDKEEFQKIVNERENQVSTSVGYKIAIPHGKSTVVTEPFVAYLHAIDEFEWDAGSNEKIHSVFMIGVPENDGDKTHLKYISKVSKRLIDDCFRTQLFGCKSSEQAFRLLELINKEL